MQRPRGGGQLLDDISETGLGARSLSAGQQPGGRQGTPQQIISTAAIPRESPLASRVANVPDITVETIVGTLPRLPRTVRATYRDTAQATDVRVLWPSPTDSSAVAKPGSYTVTGTVPGTTIEPKATVIVKVPVGITTPPNRLAEAFPLGQVVLDRDAGGRETPFIRNRDKFMRGLAASNPDSFLYAFRDAFGQPRRVGRPDDETARARERSLLERHRAGIREHDLRRSAACELPAEDELQRHGAREQHEAAGLDLLQERTTGLYVNLFVSSTLSWSERGVRVQQVTNFPYADTTRLIVKDSGQLDLKVRIPHWATRGFFVTINGRDQAIRSVAGSYVSFGRTWRANDTIDIRIPFGFYLDPVMDQPNVASIFYGPVLLAAEESGPRTDWRLVTLAATDIGKSITGDPITLRFAIDGVPFKPFFETYGRHSVYVHVTLK